MFSIGVSRHTGVMYRQRLRPCPACRSPMAELPVPTGGQEPTTVDVCESCGGMYLDYFDGEPSAIARALIGELKETGLQRPPLEEPPRCPGCSRDMNLLEYLEDDGPPLYRCSGCLAVFATPEQRRAIAEFVATADPEPSVFRRIWRGLFG